VENSKFDPSLPLAFCIVELKIEDVFLRGIGGASSRGRRRTLTGSSARRRETAIFKVWDALLSLKR
jgi:DNA-binding XRE family transcriptional regulator